VDELPGAGAPASSIARQTARQEQETASMKPLSCPDHSEISDLLIINRNSLLAFFCHHDNGGRKGSHGCMHACAWGLCEILPRWKSQDLVSVAMGGGNWMKIMCFCGSIHSTSSVLFFVVVDFFSYIWSFILLKNKNHYIFYFITK
jgi:hypothetical protein